MHWAFTSCRSSSCPIGLLTTKCRMDSPTQSREARAAVARSTSSQSRRARVRGPGLRWQDLVREHQDQTRRSTTRRATEREQGLITQRPSKLRRVRTNGAQAPTKRALHPEPTQHHNLVGRGPDPPSIHTAPPPATHQPAASQRINKLGPRPTEYPAASVPPCKSPIPHPPPEAEGQHSADWACTGPSPLAGPVHAQSASPPQRDGRPPRLNPARPARRSHAQHRPSPEGPASKSTLGPSEGPRE